MGPPTAISRWLRALDRSRFKPYSGAPEYPSTSGYPSTSEYPSTSGYPSVGSDSAERGFTGRRAAKVVGITLRQLDYWERTDLIRPSLNDPTVDPSRRYSYTDLLELRAIKTLLDAGIKLESVREIFEYLREHVDGDISSAHLVITANSVVLAQGDELIDVLQNGKGVLNVLSLAGVKDEVEAQLASPDGETADV